ncbi:MAG: 23S rRNA (uracil(1939)-C(5))-methyltransferase RlmD [Promethearchaeota archaeon]
MVLKKLKRAVERFSKDLLRLAQGVNGNKLKNFFGKYCPWVEAPRALKVSLTKVLRPRPTLSGVAPSPLHEAERTLYEGLEKRRLKRSDREVVVTTESWAADGACVAFDGNGKLLLVRFAVPGETARVRVYKESPHYGLAEPVEFLSQSAARRRPPCPLFGTCGGCDYQMLSPGDQLDVKRRFAREVFRRVTGNDVELAGTLPSPDDFHYRNTATFKVDARRRTIGFFRRDTKFIVDVERCLIAMSGINEALDSVRHQDQFPPHNFKVRTTASGDTVVHWVAANGYEDRPVVEAVAARGTRLEFEISKDAFFQVNDSLIPAWLELLCGHLEGKRVADLYCGIGLIALFAGLEAEEVVGVEISRPAVRDARKNARRNGLDDRVRFVRGDVAEVLPELVGTGGIDAVVVDPPRKGLDPFTAGALLKYRPPRVVYSSCMPSTFARDVAALSAAYDLEELHLVDFFPQTHHVEVVGLLVRKS